MSNYKERLREELAQMEERVSKLDSFILRYYTGELDIKLDCPIWVLELQLNAMTTYLTVLRKRVELEGEQH